MPKPPPNAPVYFARPAEFAAWLAAHHDTAAEVQVGYYKKHTGRPSLTWPESVDEALCYGWIDGVRHKMDEDCYTIRFTPRKPTSIWSAVNLKRVPELIAEGRMTPSGVAAYERRSAAKSGIYAYENRPASLPDQYAAVFRKQKKAWAFFEAQPPGYRRTATWFVLSAKREDTRARRLTALIECSARGERIGLLTPPPKER